MRQPSLRVTGRRDLVPTRPPQAEIPPSKAQRQELLRIIRNYVTARKPTPPLSADELRMHTESILKVAGVDETYRKFITVVVNNEVWRETVAGIPYRRRLLLLPKCFRREDDCPATFDQFGLNCKGCGRCAIDALQAEAERLGYAVLVAEGSAAITAMIEAARLEAVVGVSCLSVLEEVFPHMEAAAIPGIAIPLLYDGCRETAADSDWIWDAIHLSSGERVGRLDLDNLRRQVDAWFAGESLSDLLGPPAARTEQIARDWLARSGKRWRPFLAACTFAASGETPEADLPRDLARIGLAVECFHKASLVHDDIEDGDEVRYGQKTLHAEHGVPVALNVGDFLLGEGYRMIAAAGVPPERKAVMLRVAAAAHRDLCLGQGEELAWVRNPEVLSPAQVLAIFRNKTSPAFQVALRLGRLCAGVGGDADGVLDQYSAFLGIAYQIRDDLEDFAPDADASDARAMRPSLLLAIAYELAAGADRDLLESLWRRSRDIHAVSDRLDRILDDLNVRETTTQLLESYKAEAVRALAPLDNANLKGLLRRVLGRIFDDAELKGWCGDAEAENAPGRQAGAGPAA